MQRGAGRLSWLRCHCVIQKLFGLAAPTGCRHLNDENAFLSAEGAGTRDFGLTQLPRFHVSSCLNAGTCATMGVGLGPAITAIMHPDRPVVHLSSDSAIGFSSMEMETLIHDNFRSRTDPREGGDRRVEQWRHWPGMPEIPDNSMFNMGPNTLICGRMLTAPAFAGGRLRRRGLLRRKPEEPEGRSPRR
jgi:hypothetical protein